MKSLIFTLLAVCSAFAANVLDVFDDIVPEFSYKKTSMHNPLNTIKFTADPGVMVYNDTVYVYGTNDGIVEVMGDEPNPEGNNYQEIHSINVMSSKDLVNWVDHGTIYASYKDGVAPQYRHSWAPTPAHKTIDGKEKFFLYFANSGIGIGVLTADSPVGPWTDPLNGERLIDKKSVLEGLCKGVAWCFDPAILVDDDGTGYLYYGGGINNEYKNNIVDMDDNLIEEDPLYIERTDPEFNEDDIRFDDPDTLRVVKLGDDMISIASEPVHINAPFPYEDSGINKVGDLYYYSYCTNWSGKSPLKQASIGMMVSESPMGPFKFVDTVFNNPGDFFNVSGNNHHTIVNFHDKYYIFYHAEWLNYKKYGVKADGGTYGYRSVHVNELPFQDGQFKNATGDLEGVVQLVPVDAFAENPAALMAWQAGVSTNGLGHTTVNYKKGQWTGVSGVDFDDGATTVTISATSAEGAIIQITADSVDGEVIGYVEIPATGEDDYVDVKTEIELITGKRDIFFLSSGDVTVDYWTFGNVDDELEGLVEEATTEAEVDVEEATTEAEEEETEDCEEETIYVEETCDEDEEEEETETEDCEETVTIYDEE